jgi:hypothetical protein
VLIGTTAFAGASVMINAASRSRVERAVWVPMTVTGTALGVLALRDAASRTVGPR